MIKPISFATEPISFVGDEYFLPLNNIYNIIPDRYEISNYGTVRDIKNNLELNTKIRHVYPSVRLILNNNKYSSINVHRLVASVFCPQVYLYKNIVHHIDNNPLNPKSENLLWCTQKENIQFAIKEGTFKVKGEDNVTSRLKESQVKEICKFLQDSDMLYKDILKEVGLEVNDKNLDLVTRIKTKKIWVHISCEYTFPEKKSRSVQNIYTTSEIRKICELLECGSSISEIAKELNITVDTKKQKDCFWHFVARIRDKKSYTEISKDYKL